MTSKSLFFKLMKEDIKRKIWAVGLSFLMFFFWMPVAAAMEISSLKQELERWLISGTTFGDGITAEMQYQTRLLALVPDILGFRNSLVILTVGTAAFVLALTGFMYLHSRKQTDFYHSIPVRREAIFAVKYINGFLIVLSMYVLNMLFGIGVFAANGVSPSITVSPAFAAMLVHMAGFLLIYGLMIIAVVLTGNFFISILGGIVLFSYIPAFIALMEGLMYLFFVTFNNRVLPLEGWVTHGSPIAYYSALISDGNNMKPEQYETLAGRAALAILAALVLALVAMLLYKFRPSESAGKAMAFKISKAPIKILLVVPVTIFAALLFWNVYYTLPWAVFGFLLGLVLTHGIIEIIYHFEFRKLFANPAHMGICAVLALAVIGFFRYDVIGYDRYLPKEGEFQSASIYGSGLKDWMDYGLPRKSADDDYTWNYMDGSDYAAGNMELTDYSLVSAIAEAGIDHAQISRENQIFNRWDTTDRDGYWVSIEVGYHLKNEKKVFRNYNVNLTALRENFDALYTTSEYKSGIYPVLSYNADNLAGIYEARGGKISGLDMDAAKMEELLAAYKEELTALTLEERANTTPVTSIRFLTLAEHEYLKAITSSRSSNYSGDFRLDDMKQVNFFPVYPSFTKTISLLEEAGSGLLEEINADDVERIVIYGGYDEEISYNDDLNVEAAAAYMQTYSQEAGRNVITIENDGTPETKERIQEILNSVEIADMADMNGLQPLDKSFEVQIYFKNEGEIKSPSDEKIWNYVFRYQEVPEFIKKAAGYDPMSSGWRNINYGLEH